MKKTDGWSATNSAASEMNEMYMERQVDELAQILGIGLQDFEKIRKGDIFYLDKTLFIKEWWLGRDEVTLFTRPRRFGKTLMLSMVEQFFSVKYADRGDLFEGLKIWQDERFHQIQGTYPVLFLSFSDIKETTFAETKKKICCLNTFEKSLNF